MRGRRRRPVLNDVLAAKKDVARRGREGKYGDWGPEMERRYMGRGESVLGKQTLPNRPSLGHSYSLSATSQPVVTPIFMYNGSENSIFEIL